jgi:CheY-like chemotaxis protein
MEKVAAKKINRILLIDDDLTSNFLSQTVIEGMGFAEEVVIAEDGQEALLYVQKNCLAKEAGNCASLILLDLNMPNMDGIEFLEMLDQMGSLLRLRSKIVALTTSTHPKDMDKLKQLGVNELLNKPLTEDKLNSIRHLWD